MTRWIAVGLIVVSVAGVSAMVLAQTTERTVKLVAASDAVTVEQFQNLIAETNLWAMWACILAGLALVAAIKVNWSLGTIAKNQVKLAQAIEAAGGK